MKCDNVNAVQDAEDVDLDAPCSFDGSLCELYIPLTKLGNMKMGALCV